MGSLERQIFKRGSTTYYFSSIFFPPAVRTDVFKLYSFVRVADDLVDKTPPDALTFAQLKRAWSTNSNPDLLPSPYSDVLKNIRILCEKHQFEGAWVNAFLNAMQSDLDHKTYHSLDDSLAYVYGSAEVIGLMMARIMGIDNGNKTANTSQPLYLDGVQGGSEQRSTTYLQYGTRVAELPTQQSAKSGSRVPSSVGEQAVAVQRFARLQGRAMQWINFIRDIDEDNKLGRCYFPTEHLQKFGLENLQQPGDQRFADFIRYEIKLYRQWQQEAEAGFSLIPRQLRIPLATAVDMYNWTADQIEANPLVVFERKVKPTKSRVMAKSLIKIFSRAHPCP